MTFSADFRTQVIKSVKDMSIRQACTFYDISKTTLQRWLKNPNIKQSRDKALSKIPIEALLQDVAQYPDDYMYERAHRDETRIEFNSINFKNAKPKDTSFHEYFFEPFKNTQPETYKVLSEVKEDFFYAIQRTTIPEIVSDITAFGININGIIVYMRYTP
ncbi:IS630 transposase-related protein [Psychrobacter sp. DAB_AL62B]|uniref:IS630 transposase-related protein n=1 Tax=Psychrobacter sp. DAB_AL62B TaxID=1028420 RepID=UPI0023813BB7|nr:IS630 transposase-related protein [Psychrobacter sp. DAB_AL62B]